MNINIYFGYALLPIVEENDGFDKNFSSKVKNLRGELKNDYNIDMPLINLMDNIRLSPNEIVIESDGSSVWKQDFEDIKDFEAIGDIVINNLKNIFNQDN